MPELPEVETVIRKLQPLLTGRCIRSVEVSRHALRRRWLGEWGPLLTGRRIQGVRRHGKWIILDLDRALLLVFHLGMSGQLAVEPSEAPRRDHTHVVLGLDGGRAELRFRDARRFGSATVERSFPPPDLGPEPFGLEPAYWRRQLAKTQRALKAVLLDQRVVAGVGNIYADEALFEARLHPARPGSSLTVAEASRLRRAVVTVLNRAIKRGGTDIGDGIYEYGGYQEEFRAYGRGSAPCRRCGTPIERVRLAGRATHFCPRCQPKEG